jgi:hypothetical protein
MQPPIVSTEMETNRKESPKAKTFHIATPDHTDQTFCVNMHIQADPVRVVCEESVANVFMKTPRPDYCDAIWFGLVCRL